MNDTSQYPLNSPPTDGISEIQFSPYDTTTLLVASWDGVSVYFLEQKEKTCFDIFFFFK